MNAPISIHHRPFQHRPSEHRPVQHRPASRQLAALVLAVAALLPLAACGDEDGDAAASDRDAPQTSSTAPAPDGPIDVIANDFSFDGMPEALPAGTHTIRLTNGGKEPHELLIFQNPEGLSLDEIFALGPVEGAKRITPAGMVQVAPGQPATDGAFELTPGEWDVICFIPTTDGTSHFTHGMHQTLTVT